MSTFKSKASTSVPVLQRYCLVNERLKNYVKAQEYAKYESKIGYVPKHEYFPQQYVLLANDSKNLSKCYFQRIQIDNETQKQKLLCLVHTFANVIYWDDFLKGDCESESLITFQELSEVLGTQTKRQKQLKKF